MVSVGTFGTPVSNRELCTPKDLDSAMRNFAWTLISKSFPKGITDIHCRNNHLSIMIPNRSSHFRLQHMLQ